MGRNAKVRKRVVGRAVATGAAGIGLMLTSAPGGFAGPLIRADDPGATPTATSTLATSSAPMTTATPTTSSSASTATSTPSTTTASSTTATPSAPASTTSARSDIGRVIDGVTIPGAFVKTYLLHGNRLGKPVAPVEKAPGGYVQRYEHGGIVGPDVDAATTDDSFPVLDGFFRYWYAHRAALGVPTSVHVSMRDQGLVQPFTTGAIFWNKNQQKFVSTTGDFYGYWKGSRGFDGLAWPSGDAYVTGGNKVQRFLNGQGLVRGTQTGTAARFDASLMRAADARNAFATYGSLKGAIHASRCATRVAPFVKGNVVARTDARWCPASGSAQPTSKMTPVPSGYTVSRGWGSGKVNAIGLGWEYNNYNYRHQNAVMAFQRRVGLPVTGVVDKATWDRLGTGWSWWIDGWQTPVVSSTTATRDQHVEQMIAFAQSQKGAKYIFGGTGPAALGYACSGIVYQSLISAGVDPYPMTWVHTAAPTPGATAPSTATGRAGSTCRPRR